MSLSISWSDSAWRSILNESNVMEYFSQRSNPFYDRTCNNEVVRMQRLEMEQLLNMTGLEYTLLHVQDPILFVIRKQHRHSPTKVTPLSDYHLIAGEVYQAPDIGAVINSRLTTAVNSIESSFQEAQKFARYHPSKGYWWQFTDDGEAGDEVQKKDQKTKKHEEPSSVFQRRRVDLLLEELTRKYKPLYFQPNTGEKPVAVFNPLESSESSQPPAQEKEEPASAQMNRNMAPSSGIAGSVPLPPEAKKRRLSKS